MPKAFDKCAQKKGSRIRTVKPSKDTYAPVCIPPGGGPSVLGEVKRKKKKGK
ncbi:MAG TPA: hypothetical protein VF041_23050 [Gemmatimonadaceae bacterium]